ncbi:MAG: sigma-70 family RNA polymerase sigma factor [Desulfobacterales bacterium]|nr:sigma-70 family RNA polymerase sigma factor [Desulfobacterales bacterium]
MREEFWKRIKILLDKLSRREQEVFLLRFTDQLSIKEISRVLKKNESTVKTHLYRAINKFKKESELLQLLREETL